MDQLINRYLEDCRIRGMAAGSLPRYHSALRIFGQYLSPRGVDALVVSREDLRGFIEYMRMERGASQKTIENYFSTLSSFYDFLIFEGLASANPVLPVRKRYLKRYKENVDGHERQLIGVEDMARLINS